MEKYDNVVKSRNFSDVLTSELLFRQSSTLEQEKCLKEVVRRLKSICFTGEQIEKFILRDMVIIEKVGFEKYQEMLMVNREFITQGNEINTLVNKLTFSELLLLNMQAKNISEAGSRAYGFYFYSLVFDFKKLNKGITMVADELAEFGVEKESIQKFIWAENMVIRRKLNPEGEKNVVEAWKNPEIYLDYTPKPGTQGNYHQVDMKFILEKYNNDTKK